MIKPVFAVLALAALPAFAQAAAGGAPDVSVAFGNTIVSTYPDGRTGHLWLKKNGAYDYAGRRNTPSSGTWALRGGKICLKQKKPVGSPFTYCTTAPNDGVGTSWKAKAVTGEALTVKVVKGVVGPKPKG